MSQVQINLPQMTTFNKILIATHAGIFILDQVLQQTLGMSLLSILAITPEGISRGFYFQAFSYFLIDQSLMAVLFNCLLIWFIGNELELKWGRPLYLKFLAIAILAGGVSYIGFTSVFSSHAGIFCGLNGMILSLLFAYGYIFSERVMSFMLIFPMKAKYFCALIAGIEIYMAIFSASAMAAWCHLLAMGISFLYLKYRSLKSQGWSLGLIREQIKLQQKKKKFSIVRDEEEDKDSDSGPKYWH